MAEEVAGQGGDGDGYVGPVPGRVLVDSMMGMWGGMFSLLVVDLMSRFAGLPVPGRVMLPFLAVGFLCFAVFGILALVAHLKQGTVGELLVAALSLLVALLLLMDAMCCLLCRSYRSAPPAAFLP